VDIVTSMLWTLQLWLDANTDGGRFVLQVYDSIMVVVRDADVEKTIAYMRLLMTDNLPQSEGGKRGYMDAVPLEIDVKTGRSWGKMAKRKAGT
jgi:DNA polymerase I-like protein with 3'-5' exonuclease and polymerase domains